MLKQRFPLKCNQLVTIKTVGIGESDLQSLLHTVNLSECVQLGFRADSEHVETKLQFPVEYSAASIKTLVQQCTDLIGDYVFTVDGLGEDKGHLVNVVDSLIKKHHYKVVFVETISQGLMAAKCFGYDWLIASSFNRADLFQDHVDRIKTEQMARTKKQEMAADLVLIQEHQGDELALEDKEKSITIYNTLLAPSGFHYSKHSIAGPAKRKQNQAAILGLDLLRRTLQHKLDSCL